MGKRGSFGRHRRRHSKSSGSSVESTLIPALVVGVALPLLDKYVTPTVNQYLGGVLGKYASPVAYGVLGYAGAKMSGGMLKNGFTQLLDRQVQDITANLSSGLTIGASGSQGANTMGGFI
jgi:hypothetical protein